MKLVFDHRMFRHINESAIAENGRASWLFKTIERLLRSPFVYFPLGIFEKVATLVLCLPIPVYSAFVYALVTQMRGLPRFSGMYLRALYYRGKIDSMASNVFIDQNVFFAYPKGITLSEFCYIDKNVIIMSKTAKFGRRVHVAPRVFVSGGGELEIEDYVGIATNANIITSTELLQDGARASGPMTRANERRVVRGKVHIKRDAFVGVSATLLPGVTMGEGSVAGVGAILSRDTEAWSAHMAPPPRRIPDRAPVESTGD